MRKLRLWNVQELSHSHTAGNLEWAWLSPVDLTVINSSFHPNPTSLFCIISLPPCCYYLLVPCISGSPWGLFHRSSQTHPHSCCFGVGHFPPFQVGFTLVRSAAWKEALWRCLPVAMATGACHQRSLNWGPSLIVFPKSLVFFLTADTA